MGSSTLSMTLSPISDLSVSQAPGKNRTFPTCNIECAKKIPSSAKVCLPSVLVSIENAVHGILRASYHARCHGDGALATLRSDALTAPDFELLLVLGKAQLPRVETSFWISYMP